jgi:hypothetical protein
LHLELIEISGKAAVASTEKRGRAVSVGFAQSTNEPASTGSMWPVIKRDSHELDRLIDGKSPAANRLGHQLADVGVDGDQLDADADAGNEAPQQGCRRANPAPP